MRLYTVLRRPAPPDADPDAVLVKEGFCWPAALLAPLWLIWHRQWLGLAAYLLVALALGALAAVAGEVAEFCFNLGLAVLAGASANDWRRWRLERRGYRLDEVVAAGSLAEAEALYFGQLAASAPAAAPAAPRPAPPLARHSQPAAPLAPWSP
jgi:Protein of unknown function (DUF2628)